MILFHDIAYGFPSPTIHVQLEYLIYEKHCAIFCADKEVWGKKVGNHDAKGTT